MPTSVQDASLRLNDLNASNPGRNFETMVSQSDKREKDTNGIELRRSDHSGFPNSNNTGAVFEKTNTALGTRY